MNMPLPTQAPISLKAFEEQAFSIGKYLAREAIWDGDRCNWIGNSIELLQGRHQIVRRSFGPDRYNGTAGIALFLAELHKIRPDAIIAQVLEGAVNHVLSMDQVGNLPTNYGVFNGHLGIADALIRIGELMENQTWINEGFNKLLKVAALPLQDQEVDLMSGAAGAIPILLHHYAQYQAPQLLQAAIKAGDFLVAKAVKTETYWSWPSLPGQPALTGYSHGAAGMGLALLELFAVTQNNPYYLGAMFAFQYERLLYQATVQNWPDLRGQSTDPQTPAPTAPTYPEAWCHGAPGIAVSRLRAWQLTNDEHFLQEATIALATTYRSVSQGLQNQQNPAGYSLCHGIAGNADILLLGKEILGETQYEALAHLAGQVGIEKYGKTGLSWPSGVHDPSGQTTGQPETPGLMMGLAGTGMFYLRLAHPDRVASPLLLR